MMIKESDRVLFDEITEHLLTDTNPEVFLDEFIESDRCQSYPFDMLPKMKQTKQSPVHHPEGNVWNHTRLVVKEAAKAKDKSKDKKVFMWAALLHDIGKPDTTRIKKGKITSYDHDRVGFKLTKEFLSVLTDDQNFIDSVSSLVRWHMHILFVVNNLSFGDIRGLLNEADIDEVALLGWCDRMGRTNSDAEKEKKNIEEFLRICKEKKKLAGYNV